MDITKIILSVLTLLTAIVTSVVIPWVRVKIKEAESKLTEQQQDDLVKWAKIAVDAAEMIYKESGMGAIKKAYVEKFIADYLAKRGLVFDSEQVNLAIESAVLELKKDLKKGAV